MPTPPVPEVTFWDVLRSFLNQSLFEHFTCDDDGEWIRLGLMHGSLICVHDGSYMPKIDPHICSAAFIIKCTATGKIAKGSIVERSDDANNYRAEALGSMMLLLVLRAATAR